MIDAVFNCASCDCFWSVGRWKVSTRKVMKLKNEKYPCLKNVSFRAGFHWCFEVWISVPVFSGFDFSFTLLSFNLHFSLYKILISARQLTWSRWQPSLICSIYLLSMVDAASKCWKNSLGSTRIRSLYERSRHRTMTVKKKCCTSFFWD